MPRGLLGQAATLLFTGVLLGPVLPSAMGRITLTGPLARGIAQALRLRPNEPAAATLEGSSVHLDAARPRVAPGQVVALYVGDRVVAGAYAG